jgi:hypothetical protein
MSVKAQTTTDPGFSVIYLDFDGFVVYDNMHCDADGNLASGGCMWMAPINWELTEAYLTGGSLSSSKTTDSEVTKNQVYPPIKQSYYYDGSSSATGNVAGPWFTKPLGYTRAEVTMETYRPSKSVAGTAMLLLAFPMTSATDQTLGSCDMEYFGTDLPEITDDETSVLTRVSYYFLPNNVVHGYWNSSAIEAGTAAGLTGFRFYPPEGGRGIAYDHKYWMIGILAHAKYFDIKIDVTWYKE